MKFAQKSNQALKYISCLVPVPVVTAIMLFVYYMKGIYPFGNLTIPYSDMASMYVPFYHHLYDIVYSGKNIFWDFYSGTGYNIYGYEMFTGFFDPFTWIILLTKRENIVNFISYIIIYKISIISLCSMIFYNKVFKNINIYWKTIFSLLYAFSGYIFFCYIHIMWLDNVALFPILLLSLISLNRDKKIVFYIAILTLNIFANYYISFMLLLFIFFSSGVYFYYYTDINKRNIDIFNLGIGTIAAILLSSFITIPVATQMSNSVRAGKNSIDYIMTQNVGPIFDKIAFFTLTSIILVLTIKFMLTRNIDRRNVTAWLIIFLMSSIQVVVEGTNLIWHGGRYVCFPLRYAFIPTFLLLISSAYYINKDYPVKYYRTKSSVVIFSILSFIAYAIATAVSYRYLTVINHMEPAFGINGKLTLLTLFVCLLHCMVIWHALKLRSKLSGKIIIAIVVFTEVITYSLLFIGIPPEYTYAPEHSDKLMIIENNTRKKIHNDYDDITRYKDADLSMGVNYSLVLGRPSLSGWIPFIDKNHVLSHKSFGYSATNSKLYDTGGTIFSDTILNINYIFSKKVIKDKLYLFKGKIDDIYLYQYDTPTSFGIMFNNNTSLRNTSYKSPFDNQNTIYRAITNTDNNIIDTVNVKPLYSNTSQNLKITNINKTASLKYTIIPTGLANYYLDLSGISSKIKILVDGKYLDIHTTEKLSSTTYPNECNNGILNLGIHDKDNFTVELEFTKDIHASDTRIGSISIEKYYNFIKAYTTQNIRPHIHGNNLDYSISSKSDENILFLPITYDMGWDGKVNNERVKITRLFGNYMGINLKKGNNNIHLKFIPSGLPLGIAISILTLIVMVLISASTSIGNKILSSKAVQLTPYIYWPIYVLGILVVYVIPIILLASNLLFRSGT